MPINAYTGLMRSGKSYEVVSEVILPAIARGRRVVTNIDGISESRIHQYIFEKQNIPLASLGKVIHVDNQDVFREDFFPYFDDLKSAHVNTVVQPGDIVCIDEAWRFWGAGKIHKNHQSFFLEHGHFTDEETGVACDLVLMVQDISTLNRFLKNVVAFTFKTHKKVSLGMNNTYSINCWEGYKLNKAALVGTWIRKYKKEIFPLYSSFKGGVSGKTETVDQRQNKFGGKRIWITLGILVIVTLGCGFAIWRFFHPRQSNEKLDQSVAQSGIAAKPTPQGLPGNVSVAPLQRSEIWRIVGSYMVRNESFVVLADSRGVLRVESPSVFNGSRYSMTGSVDQSLVTVWTGSSGVPIGTDAVVKPPLPPLGQMPTNHP
ncbi:zona occludens toxin [Herbaspirillum sp. 1173]|uniref:zonular occludens toxin domain-containing protein n=1 Tax=Herbaspirillum sp. 1173 TaxID=2817734 RepID=UPI00285732E6|nr:zonular occludens toxin domain-containing protein [Herbaspirillum sp. 1173]MDR6740996.1 zona occludens toxin [Herbaspirillum sp. 1173]